MTPVTVRYWAAIRAAAGVDSDQLPVDGDVTLAWVLRQVHGLHRGTGRFAELLDICSVLVQDRPVATEEPDQVVVRPGERVELLPPFAGG